MTDGLPLPTLLSQALVAFTIEFDNEFEVRMRHRTTRSTDRLRSTNQVFTGHAPWLTSLVMWSNLMQFLGDEPVTIAELARLARTTRLSLSGMERWGYIVVEPKPSDPRPKPPRRDWVVRPTAAGRQAQQVWQPLFDVMEQRWRERFGHDRIARLKESLLDVLGRFDLDLPAYLPVLGYGLSAEQPPASPGPRSDIRPDLPTLLSQVLLAFTLEFERQSEISLAICANVLRPLADGAVRLRDLPRLSGVSKEAIAAAAGFLVKRRLVTVEPDPDAGRAKVVRLTTAGRRAHDIYRRVLAGIEVRWQTRFGDSAIGRIRESLEALTGKPGERSLLLTGLEPPPTGWRAGVPRPTTLPHYPMVLHRGGYPDGS